MGGTGSKQSSPLLYTPNTDQTSYNSIGGGSHSGGQHPNEYYDDEDEYYDDECTSIFPCFFCPPNKNNASYRNSQYSSSNNGHNGNYNGERRIRSKKKHRKHSSRKYDDPMGTPLPDDATSRNGSSRNSRNRMRQQRMMANRNNSYYYDGLEVEKHNGRHGNHYQQQGQHHDNNTNYNNSNGMGMGNGHSSHSSSSSGQWIDQKYRNSRQSNQSLNYYHQQSSPKAVVHDGMDGERQFMEKYQMSEVLGVGSTSICHRCINKYNGQSYACKIIDKVQIEQRFAGMMSQFHSEIDALRNLHHPNIIQLYDVYTTRHKIYIVMELMAGGELFDYVVTKGTLTEAEASVIVRMVTSALVYMHECNIIHRDLKPENLLLKHKPNSIYDLEVKIIDFGLSKSMKKEPMAQSFLGTRGYLAPEMLQRRQYSREVDTWALGVIVFVLLCGCLPFDDDSSTIFTDEQIQSKFKLRFPRWARNLSPSAKDLLSKLLDVNPSSRYTAVEAFNHPWICGTTAPKDSMLHSPGRINLTPGKKTNPKNVAAANRTQMNEIIKNRARANSLTKNRARASSNPRQTRQLVRKKSI